MELQTVVDAVLARLGRGGPTSQKIRTETEGADLAERQKLRAEVDRLRGELATGAPKLTTARKDAEAKLRAAQTSLRQAEAAFHTAAYAERQAVSSLEGQLGAAEQTLRASASPKIAALQSELLEAHALIRNNQPAPILIRRRNPLLDRKVTVGSITTAPSAGARMLAIVAAIRQLDGLALEALDEEALRRRLDAILADIPEVVEEQVLAGQKPSPEAA